MASVTWPAPPSGRVCADAGVPFVARGSGTGLSGVEVAVLIEGVPEGVEERVAQVRALPGGEAEVLPHPPRWWSRYPWRRGDVGLKLTAALSGVPGEDTRAQVERRHTRSRRQRLLRAVIFRLFPYPRRLRLLRAIPESPVCPWNTCSATPHPMFPPPPDVPTPTPTPTPTSR